MSSADFVTELGLLVVDHRLRRIVDQLLAAQSEVYTENGITFEPRWTSTFLLLEREGALPVTTIASRLGLSHPAIIKITNAMIAANLVTDADDADDDRRRLIRLTPHARRLSSRLHRFWEAVTDAQREIFTQAGSNVLDVIGRVEGQLTRKPLARRVAHRIEQQVCEPTMASGPRNARLSAHRHSASYQKSALIQHLAGRRIRQPSSRKERCRDKNWIAPIHECCSGHWRAVRVQCVSIDRCGEPVRAQGSSHSRP